MKKLLIIALCALLLCLTACTKIEVQFVFDEKPTAKPVIAETYVTEQTTEETTAPNVNTGSEE